MVDDMPRLSCPDLAAAIVRWQQVWEDREEAGAGLGTVLPCCCLERTPIMQQCILIAIKQEGTRGLALGVRMHGQTRAMQYMMYPSKAAG